MTQQDRRFASLKGQSRQWLSAEEYGLLGAQDSDIEGPCDPVWGAESEHDGWEPIRPRGQPFARLGDVLSQHIE